MNGRVGTQNVALPYVCNHDVSKNISRLLFLNYKLLIFWATIVLEQVSNSKTSPTMLSIEP